MEEYEKGKREVLEAICKKMNYLGEKANCPLCNEGDEESFSWCDIHVMSLNFMNEIIQECGYHINAENALIKDTESFSSPS